MSRTAEILGHLRRPHETPSETLLRVLEDARNTAALDDWAHDGRTYCCSGEYVELRWHDYWGKASRLFETKAEAAAAIAAGIL